MNDTADNMSVYEIGYLIASSVPAEKISGEVDAIKKIIVDAGSSILSEEAPREQELAYPMRVKTVSGAYNTYTSGYFGWVKFEVGSDKIEAVKKSIEIMPSVIRMLVISTVHENTYLGKRAVSFAAKAPMVSLRTEDKKEAAPISIEEMDKSIDNMVKEA